LTLNTDICNLIRQVVPQVSPAVALALKLNLL